MSELAHAHADSGRRKFLQTVLSSAVVGVTAQTGIQLAAPAGSAPKPI